MLAFEAVGGPDGEASVPMWGFSKGVRIGGILSSAQAFALPLSARNPLLKY